MTSEVTDLQISTGQRKSLGIEDEVYRISEKQIPSGEKDIYPLIDITLDRSTNITRNELF
jgi:hypothetical protein